MALPQITVQYPKTAIQPGSTAVTGSLSIVYDKPTDTLTAWSKIADPSDPSGLQIGEQQVDGGAVSEIGIENIEYMEYTRQRIPSRIRMRRFRSLWLPDIPYTAAIIAAYFDVDQAAIRQHLNQFG